MKKLLAIGSAGLIGLEVVRYSNQLGWKIIGIGNNARNRYNPHNTIGNHTCSSSNLQKMKGHYPKWDMTKLLEDAFGEITKSWEKRMVT